jgi:hypothetical protein
MVGATGRKPHLRELKMDVYQSLAYGRPLSGRPAVVLAFGGAYAWSSDSLVLR